MSQNQYYGTGRRRDDDPDKPVPRRLHEDAGETQETPCLGKRARCMVRAMMARLNRFSGSADIDDIGYAALVDRLYAGIMIPTLAPIILVPILLLFAYRHGSAALLEIAVLTTFLAFLRIQLHRRYHRARPHMTALAHFQLWDGLFLVFGWTMSLLVGLGCALMFQLGKDAQPVALVLVLSFTSITSIRNSGRSHLVIGQLVLAAVPVIAAVFWMGGIVNHVMGTALALYFFAYVRVSVALGSLQIAYVLSHRRLHATAHTDALTGLPNRLDFESKLEEALVSTDTFTLVMVDLDDFKVVNDSLGHDVGDQLIKEVGRRLRNVMRKTDYIARVGGDEFMAIQKGSLQGGMKQALQRMQQVFAEPFELGAHVVRATASIGAADTSAIGTKRDVIKAADIALYSAKAKGKNTLSFFTPDMWVQKQREATLLEELQAAVESGDIFMVFQPIVCVESGKVKSLEALMRWQSPTYGFVSPGEFIPLAEQSRLIVPLTYLSIDKAMEEAMHWPADVKVAINLSAAVFYQIDDLQSAIFNAMMKHGLAPDRIEFEITETTLIASLEQATQFIAAMRGWQIRVNLDDFGAGYSSLAYIRTLDFHKVKVDKAFIDNIVDDYKSRAIITSVNYLCTQLNMSLVVEGIEKEEQMILVAQCGVRELQGYYFDRPLPAQVVRERFEAGLLTYGPRKRCAVA